MQKRCPCGTFVRPSHRLCAKCLSQYGKDVTQWPDWLRWGVNDEQRKIDRYRRHEYAEVGVGAWGDD